MRGLLPQHCSSVAELALHPQQLCAERKSWLRSQARVLRNGSQTSHTQSMTASRMRHYRVSSNADLSSNKVIQSVRSVIGDMWSSAMSKVGCYRLLSGLCGLQY